MNSSDIPDRYTKAFSVNGNKNPIPIDSSTTTLGNGEATFDSGFPPLTMTAISAGGIPPDGKDMNGILYSVTIKQQWNDAGMGYPFNSTFAAAISGYPKGSILPSSDYGVLWLNQTNANTTNPEGTTGSSTGWIPAWGCGSAAVSISSANVTVSNISAANPRLILSGVLTGNRYLYLPPFVKDWTIENNCTGTNFYVVISTTASGGTTVISKPGTVIGVHGDGTNITSLQDVHGKAVFASNGTFSFTAPAGVTLVKATVTGAGGSGSGCQASSASESFSGGGGGAGGTAIGWVSVVPGVTYSVVVGRGGLSVSGATPGNDGGDSSFAGLLFGRGGKGASKASITNSAGGDGGLASGGDINIKGGTGLDGQSGSYMLTGAGGASYWGGGGRNGAAGGIAGTSSGSGGGGAYDTGFSSTAYSSGPGANGIVLIEY